MTVKLREFVTYTGNERSAIGQNSLDTATRDIFVEVIDGVAYPAMGTSSRIDGVSLTRTAFGATNQISAKAKLNYVPDTVEAVYEVSVLGVGLSDINVGNFYNLLDAENVDGNSASDFTGKLRLVAVVTPTVGLFQIVNK